jgi:hypothetical protein
MKTLTLVVCLVIFLGGCGSAGMGSTTNNVTMQGGQWEYTVVPANEVIPFVIDANLPTTNSSFTVGNFAFTNSSDIGFTNLAAPGGCFDLALAFHASISGTTLKGEFGQPAFANFSGELTTNGQSIAIGTYSGGFCSETGFYGPKIKGTLTGSTIAPVNGTFTGTLNSSLYGPDVVTLTITQNPDFSLKFSGTSVENGVTSDFIASTSLGANRVIGAIVSLNGSTVNINGSETFGFAAHLNSNATQMTITGMNLGMGTAEYQAVTGSLTKQ